MKALRSRTLLRMLVVLGVLLASAATLALAAKPHISPLSARSKSHTFKAPGKQATVKPACARGTSRVSGGFDAQGVSDLEGPLVSTSMASGKRWKTTGDFFDREGGAKDKLTASVNCTKRVPKITARKKSVKLAPQKAGNPKAKCPKRTQAIAGGFKASLNFQAFKGVLVNGSQRVGKRSWRVHGLNIAFTGSKKLKLTTYVYCARKVKLVTKSKTTSVSPDHTPVNLKAKCPGHASAVSGGFKSAIVFVGGSRDGNFPAASKLSGKRAWKVRAAYPGGKGIAPVKETAYVYCEK